ncbi:MAG: alcohol dehydrogenase catalytic domain-containing protein [Spirochaetaceae bacterium]|nr:MAG: alcohol dehydrogenase catalytic domain-containing protein [Spirochaetaceae bacterium]
MLGAVFKGEGRLVLEERPKPQLKSDTDALIKVTGVGICGTDLHILQVPPAHPAKQDIILGHEFTGQIVEVGSGIPDFKPGEAVLVDPHPGCGQCAACKRGEPDRCIPLFQGAAPGHCATIGIFSDGAMTSYAIVPRQSLYKVSQHVPSHIAALAEPLSCVVNAFDKLQMRPGESVVVLGAGPIGLLFTSLFKAAGASQLIISEPAEFRRETARQCGATTVVDPTAEDLEAAIHRQLPDGPNIVVEAVGPLLPQAIELVGAHGRVLQFGHDESVEPAVPVGTLLKKEVVIYGAFIGRHSFERTASIMGSGILPLETIVSHRLPLSKIHHGLDLLKQRKAIKVILEPVE